ncbi:hypothetical protein HLB23_22390 [Nocardia uniformis]|uniref:Uncharacterized protein n=2 Tax=Nocardia uniformis TaxID=53432 RepID=A0A849C8G0_9NOCA|nr:hypothetical protein [Nocardia uniformis]
MRRWCARTAGAIAVLLVTSACGSEPALEPDAPITTRSAAGSPTAGAVATVPGTLAWDFNELRGSLNGRVGLAVMAVGGEYPVLLGDWTSGSAWSTMKVPLTLAALRNNAGYSGTATSAITSSDNSAAETLWQSLGTGEVAAQSVEDVLREGGDATTEVPATRTRADYSAFGQADWSLADQIRFASNLPCLPQSDSVTSLMGKVNYGQRWGLGTLDGAEFKGGWGPDLSGNYLVRQFGLLPVEHGEIAIALAAAPTSGSFDDGTVILNKLAALIDKHLEELRGGDCPAPR